MGEYGKAVEYIQNKALVITKEIGDKQGEATDYGNLGTVFQSLAECQGSRISPESTCDQKRN